jgi:histidine triad (HIT) family protein
MPSIFTKIVRGEIPCYKIAESDQYLAFLDINPLKEGHTLVIPKKEVDYLFDLDDDTIMGLMVFSKKVAKAIKSVIRCNRVGVVIVGLEVPHAHIHLIPLDSMHDIDFSNPKLNLSIKEMESIAKQIREGFE